MKKILLSGLLLAPFVVNALTDSGRSLEEKALYKSICINSPYKYVREGFIAYATFLYKKLGEKKPEASYVSRKRKEENKGSFLELIQLAEKGKLLSLSERDLAFNLWYGQKYVEFLNDENYDRCTSSKEDLSALRAAIDTNKVSFEQYRSGLDKIFTALSQKYPGIKRNQGALLGYMQANYPPEEDFLVDGSYIHNSLKNIEKENEKGIKRYKKRMGQ